MSNIVDYSQTVDAVFTADEGRTFSVLATLAILESPHFDYSQVAVNVENPVGVYDEDDHQIGYASVYVDGNRIRADLHLDYATPERLLIETQQRLYAIPVGFMKVATPAPTQFRADVDRRLDHLLYGERRTVISVGIDGVVLTRLTPVDPRLEPVAKVSL